MIFRSPKNPNSHLTIKERKWPSFPTKQLFIKGLIKGRVLDFGCGSGVDIEFLKSKGMDVTGYDPHYQPDFPDGYFDTILCNYVLNILLPEEQAHVLMAVSELLRSGGKAYYAVRRDIKRNGFRYNPKHQCKTYQSNVILPYESIILTEHCEIYEYKHLNQILKPKKDTICSFCCPSADKKIITESATAYAMLKNSSDTKEHTLVIPKRHSNDYFDLTFREQCACWIMVNRIRELVSKKHESVGFRIEIISNVEIKSVEHAHINLIAQFFPAISAV